MYQVKGEVFNEIGRDWAQMVNRLERDLLFHLLAYAYADGEAERWADEPTIGHRARIAHREFSNLMLCHAVHFAEKLAEAKGYDFQDEINDACLSNFISQREMLECERNGIEYPASFDEEHYRKLVKEAIAWFEGDWDNV